MNTRERFEKVRQEQRNRFSLRTRLTAFVTVEMLICVLLAYGLDQLLNNVLELGWEVPLEVELISICLLIGVGMGHSGIIRIDYPGLIIYCVSASVIGQFGDLCMFGVKRVCGIKDFGNIFPGHGGMLDRFDSQLLVIPFTALYLHLTPGFIL